MREDERDTASRLALPAALLLASIGVAPVASAAPALEFTAARRVPIASPALAVAIEQRKIVLGGIPVRRAFETAKVAPDGTRRVVARNAPTVAPQVDPSEAKIERDRLPGLVRDGLGLDATPAFEGDAQLVYLMILETPVLAWEVQLALTFVPEPSRKTVWISAMTGRLLDETEQVRSARALVFAENPSKTPVPIEVPLTTLPDVEPGQPLASERIVALNCATQEPDEVPDYIEGDSCFPVHRALADENGDFFVPLPDVIDEGDSVQPEDLYAELSMYYHTERFFDALAERGVYEFACDTATLQANQRQLVPEDGLPFKALNNAFYTGQCDAERGATMLFGQGTEVDFGYDGDVVYHELGHGVVAMLTPEGLNSRYRRSDSSSVDAGAMNEGTADYLAFMLTDDPRLAEYVGRFWSANSGAQIRHGENKGQCPETTVSQVHNDGEAWQAALWATRSRLDDTTIPSQKVVLDKIVLSALTRMPPDATFEDGAAAVLAEAQDFRTIGEFDEFSFDVLERSLRVRGLVACARIITDQDAIRDGKAMHLSRVTNSVHPFVPGPMQLRYIVPEGVDAVEIAMGLRNRAEDRVGAVVLVKFGDQPIHYTYELAALDDPGDSTGESGRIREVTVVSGDWDLELDPEEVGDGEYEAPLANLSPGQVFHVALAALSTNDLTAGKVRVVPAMFDPPQEEGGSTGTGPAPLGDDGAVHGEGAVAGGCGCRTEPGSPLALLLLMLVGLAPRTRR